MYYALFRSAKSNFLLLTAFNAFFLLTSDFRQDTTEPEYVSILIEGIKMLDGVVENVPVAFDQYIHNACHAFNIALLLSECGDIDVATSLARVSCEAGSKWYLAKSDDTNASAKVSYLVYCI